MNPIAINDYARVKKCHSKVLVLERRIQWLRVNHPDREADLLILQANLYYIRDLLRVWL